jgi:hypothetical protein
MTDPSKLQALFAAALRDQSDFTGRMPKPAVPAAHPSMHLSPTAVPIRAGFKPVMAGAGAGMSAPAATGVAASGQP